MVDEELFEAWLDEELDPEAAWTGLTPGPSVDEVMSRISTTPSWFLDDAVDVVALAGDVFDTADGRPVAAARRVAATGKATARQGAGVVLWLVASQELAGPFSAALREDRLDRALVTMAMRLAAVVEAPRWVEEAERREEAARTFLLWSGQLPGREDERNARALLARLDSAARAEALERARRDREHRAEIRRRLEDARAREAASRYSPE
ncbi:hypothetical protein J2S40_004627 [Nocardioides luteus]|uniref:Phosphohydrolase n=1 Tax=Nocardioides luteus TaxID=1844 RepID=A0ABQ5SZE2_9ACTN|nr:phosphohydrolase [Nocardioides luteus]MDR7313569.1 hypothetical protein [Nocardioides luteus]GGR68920.1 hypothetical protein GCM10010197_40540 [Nocardioides luteus]GLJ69191.1 hypothetical protein GCM10017579_32270 [Nocardioides luteus]